MRAAERRKRVDRTEEARERIDRPAARASSGRLPHLAGRLARRICFPAELVAEPLLDLDEIARNFGRKRDHFFW